MCLTFRALLFVATVAVTVTTAAIGIAIVSSKQQTNIAARERNKRTKRLEHRRLEAPKKIQATRERNPFESKNLPNKHFDNRSTAEEQPVSEPTCTEQVSLSTRSPTSPQTPHPRNFWSQASTLPQTRATHQEYLLAAASHAATTQKTQKNVAATNAKTSSS